MKPIASQLLLIASIISLCIYFVLPKKEYVILKGMVAAFEEPVPSVNVGFKREDGRYTKQPTDKQGVYTLGVNIEIGQAVTLKFEKKGFFTLQKSFSPSKIYNGNTSTDTALIRDVNLLPKYPLLRKNEDTPAPLLKDSIALYNEEMLMEEKIAWKDIASFSHIYPVSDSSYINPDATGLFYQKYKVEFSIKSLDEANKKGYIIVPVPPKKGKA